MHPTLLSLAIIAYVAATGLSLAYLVQREEWIHRLPALETLDRLTYRTLALGFPFLTIGILLGVLWAGPAWGSVLTLDPLALLSVVAWTIYASTLAGRAIAGWHGRRAAYFAIFGFAALVLTLGAGLFLPGRHGS